MVSVVMITYAHEKFIKQAIEGVLMQTCDFEVELIIANDCSPDNTDTIVNDIIANHPKASWIHYTKHTPNKGMIPNFIWALNQAKGKYIALCEGDDYWIDPLKLQKQVDFLESNPDYIICGHHRYLLYDKQYTLVKNIQKQIKTQCAVFKSEPVKSEIFLKYLSEVFNGDNFLFSYLFQLGKFKILNFYGAVYRISDSGAYSLLPLELKIDKGYKTYEIKKKLFYEMGFELNIVEFEIRNFYYSAAIRYIKNNDVRHKDFYKLFKNYKIKSYGFSYQYKTFIKVLKYNIYSLKNNLRIHFYNQKS